jgi:hypothetical protein
MCSLFPGQHGISYLFCLENFDKLQANSKKKKIIKRRKEKEKKKKSAAPVGCVNAFIILHTMKSTSKIRNFYEKDGEDSIFQILSM